MGLGFRVWKLGYQGLGCIVDCSRTAHLGCELEAVSGSSPACSRCSGRQCKECREGKLNDDPDKGVGKRCMIDCSRAAHSRYEAVTGLGGNLHAASMQTPHVQTPPSLRLHGVCVSSRPCTTG